MNIKLVRTDTENKDLDALIHSLNMYLRGKDGEFHEFYPQHNTLKDVLGVILAYDGDFPIGCGAFKPFDKDTAEVKRMFVEEDYRGKGVSGQILKAIETWIKELGYKSCVLETGKNMYSAINFYKKNRYHQIPNYAPYVDAPHSVCFKKDEI